MSHSMSYIRLCLISLSHSFDFFIWSVYGKTMNGRWIGKQRESAGQKGSNILRPCPLSITRVLAAGLVPAARKKARPDLARVLADPEYRNKLYKQSQQPRSKLTGHQTCNAAELRGIDPCGSRQMCMQACPPGSLPAEIKSPTGGAAMTKMVA